MKVKVADIITELHPRYEETIKLAKPFVYQGKRSIDVQLNISDNLSVDGFNLSVKSISL